MEEEYWKWALIRKYMTKELDIYSLERIVRRVSVLAYERGRKDERWWGK